MDRHNITNIFGILLFSIILGAAATGCSDDSDGVQVGDRSLIACFYEPVTFSSVRIYDGDYNSKDDSGQTAVYYRPVYRDGWGFKLKGELKYEDPYKSRDERYTSLSCSRHYRPDMYAQYIEKYGDNGFDGNLPDDIAGYSPIYTPVESISFHRSFKGAEIEDLNAVITYRSFAEYISNGYAWPQGKQAWRKVAAKDITSSSPLQLVDASFIYVDMDVAKAREYAGESGYLYMRMKFNNAEDMWSEIRVRMEY